MCAEVLPGSATWSDGLGSGNEVTIGGIESWAVLARDQQVTLVQQDVEEVRVGSQEQAALDP